MMRFESARLGMSKKQRADDVAAPPPDRHRQVAPDRQVAGRHPMVRGVVTIPGILGDIVAADDGGPLEGWLEHLGVARHRKLREYLARYPGYRVERVGLVALVDHVVKERAE